VSDVQSLANYRLLGRSGLRVSPLSLGTMTFGAANWGADSDVSRKIFDTYVDHGGNFVDTANQYADGRSEELVGEFVKDKRDRLIIATKYSLGSQAGNPNSGGNSRRNMITSVEASLKRLGTDYIDLYYLHVWDQLTEPDEVIRAFDDLVRSGKVVYVGISDTPAWQVARMQTIADLRGWSPFVALQIEYSLVQRTVERDLIPMAAQMGLGVVPWSPLGMGMLTGKYSRADLAGAPAGAEGRKPQILGSGRLTEKGVTVIEALQEVSKEVGKSPAQVAIAWVLANPAVTSPILGARTVAQLEDNLGALEVSLSSDQLAKLAAASQIEAGFPHDMINQPWILPVLRGHTTVRPRR
jgi:aryl-alcohol dehydrogenase-like predicted oxidoreductase